jgi:hypothetical protein
MKRTPAAKFMIRCSPIQMVLTPGSFGHRLDAGALGRHAPLHVRFDTTFGLGLDHFGPLFDAGVARVQRYAPLLAVQHLVCVRHVSLVGRRGVQAVHDARSVVSADVRLLAVAVQLAAGQ